MGACREQREVERLLRENGAEFVSLNHHEKWRLANGSTITFAISCGDKKRYWKNMLADVRRALGLSEAGPPKDTPRVPRKKKPRRDEFARKHLGDWPSEGPDKPPLRSLADQLRAAKQKS